jgi:hypothetical protein
MKPDAAVRFVKRRSGTTGLLVKYRSKKMKNPMPETPKTIGIMVFAEFHGLIFPPVTIPIKRETIEPVKRPSPIQSSFLTACPKDISGGTSVRVNKIPINEIAEMGIVK